MNVYETKHLKEIALDSKFFKINIALLPLKTIKKCYEGKTMQFPPPSLIDDESTMNYLE